MTPTGVNQYLGDYQYYLEKKEEMQQYEKQTETNQINITVTSEGKVDWIKQKQIQSEQRKAVAKINRVEQEIEQTEQKIKQLNVMLEEASSDFNKAQELFEQKIILEQKQQEFSEIQQQLEQKNEVLTLQVQLEEQKKLTEEFKQKLQVAEQQNRNQYSKKNRSQMRAHRK